MRLVQPTLPVQLGGAPLSACRCSAVCPGPGTVPAPSPSVTARSAASAGREAVSALSYQVNPRLVTLPEQEPWLRGCAHSALV